MKRTAALIILAAVLALAGCGAKQNAPMGMILASGDVADYSLFVPANWTVDMSTGMTSAYVSEKDRSNVSVTRYAFSDESMTAEKYWETYSAQYEDIFGELTDVKVSDTKLGGVDAKQYEFTGKNGDSVYRFLQIICVRNGAAYVLTFTATPEKYEEHTEKVGVIISEFLFR